MIILASILGLSLLVSLAIRTVYAILQSLMSQIFIQKLIVDGCYPGTISPGAESIAATADSQPSQPLSLSYSRTCNFLGRTQKSGHSGGMPRPWDLAVPLTAPTSLSMDKRSGSCLFEDRFRRTSRSCPLARKQMRPPCPRTQRKIGPRVSCMAGRRVNHGNAREECHRASTETHDNMHIRCGNTLDKDNLVHSIVGGWTTWSVC
jgi:hypothetical protein